MHSGLILVVQYLHIPCLISDTINCNFVSFSRYALFFHILSDIYKKSLKELLQLNNREIYN